MIRIVEGVYPHAIVEGNPGRSHVRSTEGIRTVGGAAGCYFRCGEAHHSQIWNVHVGGVRTVHCDIPVASSRRQPARSAESGYEDAAIRLTFVVERQGAVGVRLAVFSLIPAPQVKSAGDSADGFHVNCALRVHSHAGLDGLARPRRQTQTLIGGVIRRPRTNVRHHRLTVRAVVLAGWIAGGSSHSHIDSNREIGNSGRRAQPDSIPQKVPVGRGYGKYRDSRWGIDCAVAYEQEGAASRSLTVCGYLGE